MNNLKIMNNLKLNKVSVKELLKCWFEIEGETLMIAPKDEKSSTVQDALSSLI